MAAHLQATLLPSLPFPSCRCHHPHPLWPSSRPDGNRNHHPFYRPALYPRYSSHGFGDPQDYRGLHPFHLSPHHHLPHQSRLPPHHPHSYPHLPLVHLQYLPWTTSPTPASAIFLVPSPPIPAFLLPCFFTSLSSSPPSPFFPHFLSPLLLHLLKNGIQVQLPHPIATLSFKLVQFTVMVMLIITMMATGLQSLQLQSIFPDRQGRFRGVVDSIVSGR